MGTTMTDSDISPGRLASDLRVQGIRALRGPNLWQTSPVIVGELRMGSLAKVNPSTVPGISSSLRELLGAQASAVESWGELFVMTTRALQQRAGADVSFARVTGASSREDGVMVAVGYDEIDLGEDAMREAARILRDCIRGDDPELADTIADLTRTYNRARPGPTSMVMIEAARKRGIPVRRNEQDSIVQLGLGSTIHLLRATTTDLTSVIATDITSDKHRTKSVLARVGLDVPKGETARSLERALEIAEDIGFPLLLKPLDANNGRGISGRIDSVEGIAAAWPAAVAEHPVVVIERFAEGNDHRVVVVNGKVVAVVERVPAHVIGDGHRTIRELAEEINLDPNRSKVNPSCSLAPLPLEEITIAHLARSGRTLDSVPKQGEFVALRATANISTGGTAIDRTDDIHPANRALCELAASATGLDVAGLDVLSPDISVPFAENGAVVIEVNASPGIRMHTHPDNGIPRDVPGAILDMLYPPGKPTAIPVVAITGTNGKTTTTRLTAHIFRETGKRVGYTTTDGIYFQEHLLMEGDFTGPFAANVILSHRSVDVAVLETARGGILRSGLGYDYCDVGIVTNVTSDHLGMRDIHTVEQLADVKAVIPSVVREGGHTILNADDKLVAAMRDRTRGEIVYFSAVPEGESPVADAHVAAGGVVARVERVDGTDQFVMRHGSERTIIAPVVEVPLTFGGMARFQYGNVLCAVAAAFVQGVPVEQIRSALMSFLPSTEQTPGRLNIVETQRGKVILDYAHNAAAIAGLLDFVAAMPATRRIALLTAPGDRRDEDLLEVGRLAKGMDLVILKEHPTYRRGRKTGEVARIMTEGLLETGFPAEQAKSFDEEHDAVDYLLDSMQDGDVVALVADDLAAVMEQLRPHLKKPSPAG